MHVSIQQKISRVDVTSFGILAVLALILMVPLSAHAQTLGYFEEMINQADNIIRVIMIPLAIGLAVLLFIWGVIKYFIYGADDESSRATGRAYMLYGVFGLAAIVAVWGFVNLLLQIFGVGADTAPDLGGYLP